MLCRTESGDFKSISAIVSKANGGIGTQFRMMILGLFGEEDGEGARFRRSWIEVASSISFQGGGEEGSQVVLEEREGVNLGGKGIDAYSNDSGMEDGGV